MMIINVFRSLLAGAAIVLLPSVVSSAKLSSLRGENGDAFGHNAHSKNAHPRILEHEEEGLFLLAVIELEDNTETVTLNVQLSDGIYEIVNASTEFAQTAEDLRSGVDHVVVPGGASKSHSTVDLHGVTPQAMIIDAGGGASDAGRRLVNPGLGWHTVRAVHVVANDASTTSSEAQIGANWFSDALCLQNQMEACSHNQFRVDGSTTTATITTNVIGVERGDVANDVLAALGYTISGSPPTNPDGIDFVALCLPPGTLRNGGGWGAYAYVNYWLSVYNDDACDQVSTQMHEVS